MNAKISIKCKYCGKEIYDYKSNYRVFCSQSCSGKWKCINIKNEFSKLPGDLAELNKLYYEYRHDAIRRNRSFKLGKKLFRATSKENCYYCNSFPITRRRKTKHFNQYYPFNGIDRIDSGKGYIKGNILPCCKTCNRMKMDMTIGSFILRIKKIYENLELHKITIDTYLEVLNGKKSNCSKSKE